MKGVRGQRPRARKYEKVQALESLGGGAHVAGGACLAELDKPHARSGLDSNIRLQNFNHESSCRHDI